MFREGLNTNIFVPGKFRWWVLFSIVNYGFYCLEISFPSHNKYLYSTLLSVCGNCPKIVNSDGNAKAGLSLGFKTLS